MYLHGPRLLADRLASSSKVRITRTVDRGLHNAASCPGDTRWQRTKATALESARVGYGVGAYAVYFGPHLAAFCVSPGPSRDSWAAFGYTRLPAFASRLGLNPYLPNSIALLLSRFALGTGKERVGINLKESSNARDWKIVDQYGVLGLPEFGFTLAASRLHTKGHHFAASACHAGAYLAAAVLEAPRLILAVAFSLATFAGGLAGGAIGAIIGAVVGALSRALPTAYRPDAAASGEADLAGTTPIMVRPDLMEFLATQASGAQLRDALAACCRDEANFTANAAALDALTKRLDDASRPRAAQERALALAGDTYGLEILELAVGPLRDPDAFTASYRPRSLRLHPDRLTGLRLDDRSRELARKAWNVLSVANCFAQSMREGGNDARVPMQDPSRRPAQAAQPAP